MILVLLRLFLIALALVVVFRLIRLALGTRQTERVSTPKDPFEVLGLTRGASAEQIKAAYYQKLAEYHPDKVAHLGAELQSLAQEKTQQIVAAYKATKEF